ncbi:hypothetical protein PRIPAC_92281 [Pristionchus pacificus]|uniref:Uncharacterized protein n=1 Tax=Pristionchus pacificus TaxID=54126 RepID=A0A2A6BR09_PRIPA|nr:hypothetical protein PRIPAC_92281 [Pristionchus pacificus]|eukprot:PDM68317.1 hypothetical protein PRIPAC_46361 [Pristionchus pacificus]
MFLPAGSCLDIRINLSNSYQSAILHDFTLQSMNLTRLSSSHYCIVPTEAEIPIRDLATSQPP